ncbi:hypothetical protein HPB51_002940 [Rhipicephalus microplus]|uniref:Uncharacterized protein n=1 Tax=Rhipicephalus microplus TaxID=6941 RepID=A0A9J6DSW4_RHIMP|nr:hypothetical protein HPB51_002940 [Rhipicephalus microplus]
MDRTHDLRVRSAAEYRNIYTIVADAQCALKLRVDFTRSGRNQQHRGVWYVYHKKITTPQHKRAIRATSVCLSTDSPSFRRCTIRVVPESRHTQQRERSDLIGILERVYTNVETSTPIDEVPVTRRRTTKVSPTVVGQMAFSFLQRLFKALHWIPWRSSMRSFPGTVTFTRDSVGASITDVSCPDKYRPVVFPPSYAATVENASKRVYSEQWAKKKERGEKEELDTVMWSTLKAPAFRQSSAAAAAPSAATEGTEGRQLTVRSNRNGLAAIHQPPLLSNKARMSFLYSDHRDLRHVV